jgi:RimJ/RimL family protein N-acetyltransferase
LRYRRAVAEVTKHDDLAEFWALTGDFFNADPVFHTVPIGAVHRRLHHPDPDDAPPRLVTVVDDGVLVAAAVRTPPWPVTLSGVPPEWAETVADALLGEELPGANGPRDAVEAFVVAWAARTGCGAREVMSQRLYQLEDLVFPEVPGRARLATEDDVDLLLKWYEDFRVEATGQVYDEELRAHAARFLRASTAAGAGHVIWCDGGDAPVSWASANAPASGMSRIGPVYTPPEHRMRGYGAAVTAACSAWAREAGAEHVVLYTDLENPTSNSVYQRIGFRPVIDSAEFEFTPAAG